MSSIIEDIIDMAKFKHKTFGLTEELFDLHALMHDTMDMLGDQVRQKGIIMKEVIGHGLPQMVCSDPKRMKQVFVNLVGNAMKFTAKGHILLKCTQSNYYKETFFTRFDGQEASMLNKDPTKKILSFEVEDTGIGIEKHKLTTLFKAFGKLDDKVGLNKNGVGLGLMISKDIVEASGGQIKIESEFGVGTKFKFDMVVGIL